MSAPNFLSVTQAIFQLQTESISEEDLLEACLGQVQRLNPILNAFITLAPEPQPMGDDNGLGRTRGKFRAQEQKGTGRILQGIPIAVKDLFETANIRTTGGSLFFKDHIPTDDAVVIKMLKQTGAVVIGKTNTHEIALGVTTQNPHFGACHNPWDLDRIPGGSSGGSAAAVATGMALAALGTDTGGSIRIPASLCGVVGLKPTYGRVSVRGVIPLSWNLDHVGPLTNTVEDAALLLQLMAGYDPDDPWSVDRQVDDYQTDIGKGVEGWRIALGVGEYIDGALPEIREAAARAGRVLEGEGALVEEVDLSFLREAALANGIMTQADAAAFHRERLEQHPEQFGKDVRSRLEAGRAETSTGYSLARRTQIEMKRRLERLFQSYDVLVLPATPIAAPLIRGDDAVEQARRLTRFTAPFNLTGLPAISLPSGLNGEGLPMGVQMVAPPWQEGRLLRAAYAYERAAGEMHRRPPLAVT